MHLHGKLFLAFVRAIPRDCRNKQLQQLQNSQPSAIESSLIFKVKKKLKKPEASFTMKFTQIVEATSSRFAVNISKKPKTKIKYKKGRIHVEI